MRPNRKATDYDLAGIIIARENIKLAIDNAQRVIYTELAKLQNVVYDIAHKNCSEIGEECSEDPVYDVLHVNEKGEVIGFEERVPDDDDDDEDEEDED